MVSANVYSYFVSFTAAMGGFLFGYEIGVINSILEMPSFKLFFGLNAIPPNSVINSVSYVVASLVFGCIPGALLMGFLAPRLGRKKSLWFGCIWFCLGALLQTIVPESLTSNVTRLLFICFGRFFGGFGVGILSMSVPLFIAELAPTRIRGLLTSLYQLMITIGIFVSSSINAILIVSFGIDATHHSIWRIALGLQLLPGLLLAILLVWIPESPRWLLSRKREDEALEALCTLKQAPSKQYDPVQQEFLHLQHAIEEDRKTGQASWRELLGPGLGPRVGMAMLLQFFQQWTGINAIFYYSAELYKRMGATELAATTYLVVIQALANVLATFPAIFLIEKLGRKKLLVSGGVGISVSLTLALIFLYFKDHHYTFTILSIVSIYLFIVFFASTWGPVVWVIQSEIFPQRARERAIGLATASNWINNFFITLFYPFLRLKAGTFQLVPFVVTSILMTVYVFICVPETKGKTIEEMDHVFRSKKEWSSTSVHYSNDSVIYKRNKSPLDP